jgi:hypothetical protein
VGRRGVQRDFRWVLEVNFVDLEDNKHVKEERQGV